MEAEAGEGADEAAGGSPGDGGEGELRGRAAGKGGKPNGRLKNKSMNTYFIGNLCCPCLQTKYLVILRPGMVHERGRVYCL